MGLKFSSQDPIQAAFSSLQTFHCHCIVYRFPLALLEILTASSLKTLKIEVLRTDVSPKGPYRVTTTADKILETILDLFNSGHCNCIKALEISSELEPHSFDQHMDRLSRAIARCTDLRRVNLSLDCPEDRDREFGPVLNSLESLPMLASLTLSCGWFRIGTSQVHEDPFRSLKEVKLGSKSGAFVPYITGLHKPLPSLRSLELQDVMDGDEGRACVKAISELAPNLAGLTLEINSGDCDDTDTLNWNDLFEPLLRLRNLRKIMIAADQPLIGFSDENLGRMTSAWPQLRNLRYQGTELEGDGPTLMALSSLSASCLELRQLSLSVRASPSLSPFPATLPQDVSNRLHQVQLSIIDLEEMDPDMSGQVAAMINQLWPNAEICIKRPLGSDVAMATRRRIKEALVKLFKEKPRPLSARVEENRSDDEGVEDWKEWEYFEPLLDTEDSDGEDE